MINSQKPKFNFLLYERNPSEDNLASYLYTFVSKILKRRLLSELKRVLDSSLWIYPMDTTQIILEEVPLVEFTKMQQFWRKSTRLYQDDIYSRIRNPITETNYERLLFSLLDHPEADLLCVHNRGKWEKRHNYDLTDPEIRELAKIASTDSRKRNFLEMKFNRKNGWFKTATLEFIEYQGMIISYDIVLGSVVQEYFTIKAEHSFQYNNGLWIPD